MHFLNRRLFAVTFSLFFCLLALDASARSNVVISQVYGGGGNSGATYKNDFIELTNRGTTPAVLNGWSVQYTSTAGTSWQVTALPASVTLQPGQYFLIQEAAGTGGTTNLPTPDATGTIPMGATGSKVALVSSTVALTGACPAGFIDLVGSGTANCYEGSEPAFAPSNTTANYRHTFGCKDTDNNGDDFGTFSPEPRNTASPFHDVCASLPPNIAAPAVPIASVLPNAAPFNVNLKGSVEVGLTYTWSATPGTGITSANVFSGQGTNSVTYTVTLQAGFSGTAKFTAILNDGVNTPATRDVYVEVTGATVNHIVISQVYGGGGNSGATWRNDYVELYNPTAASVDLTGWTLQYQADTSTGTYGSIQPIGGTMGPAEYYLVQLGSGGAVGAVLPVQPNVIGDINMSATSGKIALVSSTDPVVSPCYDVLVNPTVVDYVGFGTTANCREGVTNAPAPSATNADFRKNGGATDTNSNGSDFQALAANPRRTTPIQELRPVILSHNFSSETKTPPKDLTVQITFTEPVFVDSGWFDLTCTSGPHNDVAVAMVAPRSIHVTPNVPLTAGEPCTVTIYGNKVHDVDTDDATPAFDTLPGDSVWSFNVSTGPAPLLPPSVHLTMGNPSNAVADTSASTNYLMMKPEYAVSYNSVRGGPNWVSWHLSDDWTVGSGFRDDSFRPDPELPLFWYRVLSTDLSSPGFDRGHMCPSADRVYTLPVNQATFLMDNMLAQASNNNQGPWEDFESYLRTLVPANELYIVAGGYGTGGVNASGVVVNTLANGNVTVPASTWKVVLVLPKASGDDVARVTASTRTIAVLMPNSDTAVNINDKWNDATKGYVTTVDAIEALTGYDFFPNVPDAIENAIEAGTNGVNPPGASNKSSIGDEDAAQPITLEGVSPTGASLTYTVVALPANGSLAGSGSSLTYTPAADYNGSDSFTYKVNDGTGDSNIATVSITVREVNDAPVAAADTKTTGESTPLAFNATDLTANDATGPANESTQTLSVTAVASTVDTHGSVVLNAGVVTYTPTIGYSGSASFTYTVCDDGLSRGLADSQCAVGTVNLTVTPSVATHFGIALPPTVTIGVPFTATVSALDAWNNVVTEYTGTVQFSSGSAGVLPANYTFTGADAGAHAFSVTLSTLGTQTLQVTDGQITGAATTDVVCAAITVQISSPSTLCSRGSGSASVAGSPSGSSYQWTIGNGTITGGNGTQSIQFTVGTSGTTRITVSVTSGSCTFSDSRSVTIRPLPTAVLPPVVGACGGVVSIPVTLTGTAPWTIVWSDGFTQSNITTSSTTRSYDVTTPTTLSVASVQDASCSSGAPSTPVQIVIDQPVVIVQQPVDVNVAGGEKATFSVLATGSSALHYQWFVREGEGVARAVGTDSPTFVSEPVRGRMQVWVVVSDACGSVESHHVQGDILTRRHAVRL